MQKGVWAGEKLQALLRERGMTQEQLGKAAGLRRTDINRYVRNKQRLGERNAERLAAALGIEIEELGLLPGTDGGGPPTREQLDRIEALLVEAQGRLERIEQTVGVGLPEPAPRRRGTR